MSAMLITGGCDTNNAAAAGMTGTPRSRRSVPSVGGGRSGSGEAQSEGVAISALLTSWFLLFLSQREWGSCERSGVCFSLISARNSGLGAESLVFPSTGRRMERWAGLSGGKSSQDKRAAGRAGGGSSGERVASSSSWVS